MRIDDIAPAAADAFRSASGYLTGYFTPTVRIGVTGLARAGKTVFITALVRALVSGGRLPFFSAQSQGRIAGAWLEPQPDDAVPRFDYEAHIAALGRDPPEWPQSTRSVSELRVTVSFRPESVLWRALGTSRLHVDIVDYPGEWLVDLALLGRDFATWSDEALTQARLGRRAGVAAPFLAFLDGLATAGPLDEQTALAGARLFTDYLAAARGLEHALATLTPGRFLMPGDLAGSPLLTFFPVPASLREGSGGAGFGAMLARRFESYKTHVVRPFFRDHFSRLDRQIVLVDALGALDAGAEAMAELQAALDAVLAAFRPGQGSWLDLLVGRRRIDRLLFAATKADHLHHGSHERLEAVLRALVERSMGRAAEAGALVRVMPIAALRATREGSVRQKDGPELPVIIGVPMPGERIGAEVFDGRREAAVFPGDLPTDPAKAIAEGRIAAAGATAAVGDVRFVRFRPPRLVADAAEPMVAPHIRLDRAIEFLIGDRLL